MTEEPKKEPVKELKTCEICGTEARGVHAECNRMKWLIKEIATLKEIDRMLADKHHIGTIPEAIPDPAPNLKSNRRQNR